MKLLDKITLVIGLPVALLGASSGALALEEAQVKTIMKQSNCFKCHVEAKGGKAKNGPSYQEIAEKNRGKADIEAKFYKRVTTLEKVEIKGKKEDHDPLKTKDDAEVKAVVAWILSR